MALREEFLLSNGMPAVFEMPDMLALVAGSYDLPNGALAGVLDLLVSGQPLVTDPKQLLVARSSHIETIYEIVALCLVTPKLKIRRTKKRGVQLQPGEIGPSDLAWGEVLDIYNRFRYGIFQDVSPAAPDDGGGAPAAPAGDDLPHDAQ